MQQQRLLLVQRTRQCVLVAIHRIVNTTKCDRNAIDTYAIKSLDECYRTAAAAEAALTAKKEDDERLTTKNPSEYGIKKRL